MRMQKPDIWLVIIEYFISHFNGFYWMEVINCKQFSSHSFQVPLHTPESHKSGLGFEKWSDRQPLGCVTQLLHSGPVHPHLSTLNPCCGCNGIPEEGFPPLREISGLFLRSWTLITLVVICPSYVWPPLLKKYWRSNPNLCLSAKHEFLKLNTYLAIFENPRRSFNNTSFWHSEGISRIHKDPFIVWMKKYSVHCTVKTIFTSCDSILH